MTSTQEVVNLDPIFMNGALLDGQPHEYLHIAGKLAPSTLSYLIDKKNVDTISDLTLTCILIYD